MVGTGGAFKAFYLMFVVEKSKTDQHGYGRINIIEAQFDELCTVSIMEYYFNQSFMSGATATDSLFHIPGFPTLSPHILSCITERKKIIIFGKAKINWSEPFYNFITQQKNN